MRIGVDARLLSVPLMGIGRYTAEMVRALKRQQAELCLYTVGKPRESDWEDKRTSVRVSAWRHRVLRMLWSQSLLPYWAGRDDVDVFWGTTHRIPRLLPSRVARVVTIHDLVWRHAGETMRPLSRLMEQWLMPQTVSIADRVIADSASTAADLEAEFPQMRGRVRVVHLGPTTMPQPHGRKSLQALGINRSYLLFVGTLEPRKNLERLLEAFGGIPQHLKDRYQLVIAGGDGWGNIDLPSLVRRLGLEHSVCVTGFVTDEQLASLYAHAYLLAMPSLYEGFGLPLLEAMSFGVPVLTSNISSLPEVAGDAAILVNPLDVGSIVAGLTQALTNNTMHAALSANAKERAKLFSWDKAATEVREIFREAVEDRRQMGLRE
jgi:glycosyltransferase involved in cell wall biosynthesis